MLYTLNSKTAILDKTLGKAGLEVVGWILKPVDYLKEKGEYFWNSYIYLVNLKQENDLLKEQIDKLLLEKHNLEFKLNTLERFASIFHLNPFPEYKYIGSRILAKRLGPGGLLETIVLDKGEVQGLKPDDVVLNPYGVIGRLQKVSLTSSLVLLACDSNSKIAVVSAKHRVPGILKGEGYRSLLSVLYVPKNVTLEKGEILLTSGTDEFFPPGLPIAKIDSFKSQDISLFLDVKASLLVDPYLLEEVLILRK